VLFRSPEAKKIVSERKYREVIQLFRVNPVENFVVDGIVHELLYKDFRSVYEEPRAVEISNLEQNAKENHDVVRVSMDPDLMSPKRIFFDTIDKPIESDLLPKGPIYRKGCYIYLTGNDIEDDIQITWDETNDGK
jgi:hypothetical protein